MKPFGRVDEAVVRYLTEDEAVRLVAACPEDFGKLVQAALLTGCRYSELTRLRVGALNTDSRTLAIRLSKGKGRHVTLTDDAVALFLQWRGSKGPKEHFFLRADGNPWGPSHQQRPLEDASRTAQDFTAGDLPHPAAHAWFASGHARCTHGCNREAVRPCGHADDREALRAPLAQLRGGYRQGEFADPRARAAGHGAQQYRRVALGCSSRSRTSCELVAASLHLPSGNTTGPAPGVFRHSSPPHHLQSGTRLVRDELEQHQDFLPRASGICLRRI